MSVQNHREFSDSFRESYEKLKISQDIFFVRFGSNVGNLRQSSSLVLEFLHFSSSLNKGYLDGDNDLRIEFCYLFLRFLVSFSFH